MVRKDSCSSCRTISEDVHNRSSWVMEWLPISWPFSASLLHIVQYLENNQVYNILDSPESNPKKFANNHKMEIYRKLWSKAWVCMHDMQMWEDWTFEKTWVLAVQKFKTPYPCDRYWEFGWLVAYWSLIKHFVRNLVIYEEMYCLFIYKYITMPIMKLLLKF